MAFGGSGGAGKVKSDINVTPLVDVVLVLLIIFLVAMPVVLRNITLEIPRKLPDPPVDVVLPDNVTVEIAKGGALLLNGHEIDRVDLASKLRDKLEHHREKVVFVDFDDGTRYGDAVSVIDTCRGAGATTVGLKIKDTDAPAGAPASAPASSAPAVTPPK